MLWTEKKKFFWHQNDLAHLFAHTPHTTIIENHFDKAKKTKIFRYTFHSSRFLICSSPKKNRNPFHMRWWYICAYPINAVIRMPNKKWCDIFYFYHIVRSNSIEIPKIPVIFSFIVTTHADICVHLKLKVVCRPWHWKWWTEGSIMLEIGRTRHKKKHATNTTINIKAI